MNRVSQGCDWALESIEDENIPETLQLLTSDTADATAELYADVFLQDEPMTRSHGIDPRRFLPCAREYLHFCAGLKLSFVACNRKNGIITAFVLASDLATRWESAGPGIAALFSYFPESMAIIDELESRCPGIHGAEPGRVLHIFQAGTMREHRGRGLVTRLVRCTQAHAKKHGFQRIIADCTGPVSQHVFERCGFHCAAYIPYHDFLVEGEAFFSALPGGISLMVRDIW